MTRFQELPPISLLPGSSLSEVNAREHDWAFQFDNGVALVTESHWRLLNGERVLVTDEDHAQLFGLSEPVNAALVVREEIADSTVRQVAFSDCSDLVLQFTNGRSLALLISSAGYENWHVYGPDGSHTFAKGGGELCRLESGRQ